VHAIDVLGVLLAVTAELVGAIVVLKTAWARPASSTWCYMAVNAAALDMSHE
jgi:hypothetical protein